VSDIRLVVQSDDFGMCHSGNLGVVEAFTNGILTQASVMVACPWFREAAGLAAQRHIPTGVHLMVTAEWDYLRWGPLTGGPSLVAEDGRFPRTIEAARESADPAEIVQEFAAQVEAYRSEGLEVSYFDCHMGIVTAEPYVEMCERYDRPFIYPIGVCAVGFDSIFMLSRRASEEKLLLLIQHIEQLEPGKHIIVSHCAVDSEELRAMTSDAAENAPWRNEYRVSDLAVLTAPEARAAIERRGVELVSVADL
jgi:predicted glycoside hydrolase/deacetylase ChbG (UPF0249 family)